MQQRPAALRTEWREGKKNKETRGGEAYGALCLGRCGQENSGAPCG